MNFLNFYILPIILGLIPIVIWLIFFLWQDIKKPEPTKWLIKAFLLGIIIVPIVALIQYGWSLLINIDPNHKFQLANFTFSIAIFYLGAAFIEEIAKFFSAFFFLKKNPHFNEVIDAMIYPIVVAMGFAAVENILFVSAEMRQGIIIALPIQILVLRFIGANLLHAICSGIIGFFWSKQLLSKKWFYLIVGIILSTILHWLFNLVIIVFGAEVIFLLAIILFIITLFLLWAFDFLSKIKILVEHKL